MARIGGRSTWFAWLVGLVCLGIVAALGWLALPAVPGVVAWVGDTLRGPTSAPDAGADRPAASLPAATATDGPVPTDCRALYSDALWAELDGAAGARLAPGGDPVPVDTSLAAALSARPALTCSWRRDGGGTISTTVFQVAGAAPQLAEAALSAAGFDCASDGGVHCERANGEVVQVHDVEAGLWAVTRFDGWRPDGYAADVVAHVWPASGG